MSRFILYFLLGLGLSALLHNQFFGSFFALNERMGYAAGSALLLAWLLTSVQWKRFPSLLKGMGVWIGILFALVLGYGFRPEILDLGDRFLAALRPQQGFSQKSGSWSVFKSSDGHFYVELLVNRIPIRFLVDTGASDIMLTRSAARKIGLQPDRLDYTRVYWSANGKTHGAPIKLDEIRLGELILQQVPASVNAGESDTCLLGMAFFKRLDAYEFKQNLLTFRWKVKEAA